MKKTPKQLTLLFQVIVLGLLGLMTRLALYRFGFDEKGILSASHPLHIACCVLVPAAAVWILVRLRSMKKRDYRTGTWAKPLGLFSGIAGSGLMLLHTLTLLPPPGPLPLLRALLAIASCAAMILAMTAPKKGHRIRTVCYALICSSYTVDMVCRYQSWSGNPQLPDYVFHVLACIFLSLCAYQRLAMEVGLGKRKAHIFCSLMALFLCLLSASGPEPRAFFLAGACWAGAGISTPKFLSVPKEAPEPAPEETTPEKEDT